MARHDPKTISIRMGCVCGWQGQERASRTQANQDFSDHLVEMIHQTRSPSWAAKHPDTGGNDERARPE